MKKDKKKKGRRHHRFPGRYEFVLAMPRVSRSYYLTLEADDHRQIRRDLSDCLEAVFDIDQLRDWEWAEDKVVADETGYKPEEEIREELERLVGGLHCRNHRLSILPRHGTVPVILNGDKLKECYYSNRLGYTIYLGRGRDPEYYRPWILTLPRYPQVIFEARVEIYWISPPHEYAARGQGIPVEPPAEGPVAGHRSKRKKNKKDR